MTNPENIVMLTGAGVSAESGVQTFRAANGLWENHRVEEVASPAGFAADPGLVNRFYNLRRRQLVGGDIQPNAAHHALAQLERRHYGEVLLVTQNIDDLHERAGSRNVIHMHGELLKKRCNDCAAVSSAYGDIVVGEVCSTCGRCGTLRPNVVWFGEMPFDLDRIYERLRGCELFVSIGTSGNVYPAAGFVDAANASGAHTVELNLEPSAAASAFKEKRYGPASEVVTRYVTELLSSS